MSRGYVIALVDVLDEQRYAAYRAGVGASLEPYGGRFLVRGGATECVEGRWEAGRTVVIEFPSVDQARAWYRSEEYQRLAAIRREASTGDIVLVEGA